MGTKLCITLAIHRSNPEDPSFSHVLSGGTYPSNPCTLPCLKLSAKQSQSHRVELRFSRNGNVTSVSPASLSLSLSKGLEAIATISIRLSLSLSLSLSHMSSTTWPDLTVRVGFISKQEEVLQRPVAPAPPGVLREPRNAQNN